MQCIGIRREDKNQWERRVPLVPEDTHRLKQEYAMEVRIQPSTIRIFTDKQYIEAGSIVDEKLLQCSIVFAIKEIPIGFFEPNRTYIFFSHTIKGQSHNMSMLKRMMDLKCQLIDYEKVIDETGRRLIFFGRYAGLAGMIDTLWALGKRLDYEKIDNPFSTIRTAHEYRNLDEAQNELANVGKKIATIGLPRSLTPLICGFMGYGNVSKGAQEILDILPTKEITPQEIEGIAPNANLIYKVVFKEEDMVELNPKTDNRTPITEKFDLQDYYTYPEKYISCFEQYIPHLTLLINSIYWDTRYPRFVTKNYLKSLYHPAHKIMCGTKLKVIGDLSCDVDGAIECTLNITTPANPVFVYNPLTEEAITGVEGVGPVILAVDNLPCELPRESSIYFSQTLMNFIPQIAKADFRVEFEQCNLPPEIRRATILYHGKFTPDYKYMEKFL
ncbi:MAG: hypothetical protein HY769_07880 [Candidatus Stahlbacteria bacterium]|nr:hypothetical protein [Candidatus Stahlbacteria bacterium]